MGDEAEREEGFLISDDFTFKMGNWVSERGVHVKTPQNVWPCMRASVFESPLPSLVHSQF